MIAIDFETDLISEAAPIPAPVCLSWARAEESGLIVDLADMQKFLLQILTTEDRVVAHNLKFELLVIYKHFPTLRPVVWEALESKRLYCTYLYEVLIGNVSKKDVPKKNLAALVQHYFDVDISEGKTDPDAWRYRYSELRGVPLGEWPQEAVSYAINDSIWAYKLWSAQLAKRGGLKYFDHIKADFTLNLMAATGMVIDGAKVALLEAEIRAVLTPETNKLMFEGYVTLNKKGHRTKNMKKFRELIKNTYTDLEYTDKGEVSVAAESLNKYLTETQNPILQSFLHITEKEKILTAFVMRLKQANPLIYTNYDAIKRSGRTSSKTSDAYPSVNIQQMPRSVKGVTYDVRSCFVPRDGFEFVSIDYSGLELAATANQLARVFSKSQMADTINSGDAPVDMHSKLACQLMSIKTGRHISYEEFLKNKKNPEYAEFRQIAKPINLGFPGGIGYSTMRHLMLKEGIKTKYFEIKRSDSEVKLQSLAFNLKRKYTNVRVVQVSSKEWALVYDELVGFKQELFKLYPDLEKFLKTQHIKYQTSEFIISKNEFGQWEHEQAYAFETTGVRRDWCTYTAFCNGYLMQTPAAAGAKDAVYQIVKKYYENPDLNPLAFIHDEIIFEVRGDKKFELIDDVAKIMITSMQKALPNVRIACEASLMDYWAKSGGKWEAQYWQDVKSDLLNKKEL